MSYLTPMNVGIAYMLAVCVTLLWWKWLKRRELRKLVFNALNRMFRSGHTMNMIDNELSNEIINNDMFLFERTIDEVLPHVQSWRKMKADELKGKVLIP